MSGAEWLVVLIAGAGGYWLVSFLMRGRKPPAPPTIESTAEPPEDNKP